MWGCDNWFWVLSYRQIDNIEELCDNIEASIDIIEEEETIDNLYDNEYWMVTSVKGTCKNITAVVAIRLDCPKITHRFCFVRFCWC
jgi:hypothetical protein